MLSAWQRMLSPKGSWYVCMFVCVCVCALICSPVQGDVCRCVCMCMCDFNLFSSLSLSLSRSVSLYLSLSICVLLISSPVRVDNSMCVYVCVCVRGGVCVCTFLANCPSDHQYKSHFITISVIMIYCILKYHFKNILAITKSTYVLDRLIYYPKSYIIKRDYMCPSYFLCLVSNRISPFKIS